MTERAREQELLVRVRPQPRGAQGEALRNALAGRAARARLAEAARPSPWKRAALREGVRRWPG